MYFCGLVSYFGRVLCLLGSGQQDRAASIHHQGVGHPGQEGVVHHLLLREHRVAHDHRGYRHDPPCITHCNTVVNL